MVRKPGDLTWPEWGSKMEENNISGEIHWWRSLTEEWIILSKC